MIWAVRYLPALGLLAALAWAGVTVLGWKVERNSLRAENASLARSVTALEYERDQAREGRAVADAAFRRIEGDAAKYDRLREEILRDEDYTLDDLIADLRALGLVRRDGAD